MGRLRSFSAFFFSEKQFSFWALGTDLRDSVGIANCVCAWVPFFFFFFFLEKELDQLHGPAEAFPGSRQATCRGGGGDLVGPASYRVA